MRDTIWVVRDPSGKVIGASVVPRAAVRDVMAHCGSTTKAVMLDMETAVYDNRNGERYEQNGYTLTRESLAATTRVRVLDEATLKAAYTEGWNTGTWEEAREKNGSNAQQREYDWSVSETREAFLALAAPSAAAGREVTEADTANALHAAVAAIYFADSADYPRALWSIVRALGGDEMCDALQINESAVYEQTRALAVERGREG